MKIVEGGRGEDGMYWEEGVQREWESGEGGLWVMEMTKYIIYMYIIIKQ